MAENPNGQERVSHSGWLGHHASLLWLSATAAALALGLCLFGAAPRAQAGNGGTGSLCSLTGITVKVYPTDQYVEYIYEVDCPGQPLGWFGGNATAKYEVIGNWDWQTMTVHDNVFSFDRNEGEFDTWTCSDDPWTTAAIYPGESGWPNGHVCTLQSQTGGSDWGTDTNPSGNFGDAMCFNDPWGPSLAGCWSNDDLSVTGPSASLLLAYNVAKAESEAQAQSGPAPTPAPAPFPVHLLPIPGIGGLLASTPTPSAFPVGGHPIEPVIGLGTATATSTATATATPSPTPSPTPSTTPGPEPGRERPRP
jgi:hypothetical protein